MRLTPKLAALSTAAWFIPICILLASLAIRLVYFQQISSLPTFAEPIMDEAYHVRLADQINSDDGLPDEPYYRAPLYPHFFASLCRLTNQSLYLTRLIQVLMGAFLPLLLYFLGLRLAGPRIGFWTASLAVFYPTFLYYDVSLLITSLMVILTTLLVIQLFRCQDNPKPINFFFAGMLLGLAGLARPNILIVGPVLFIWVWLILKPNIGWNRAVRSYLLIAAAAFIVVLPITIRNYVVSGDPVFIAWQGGYNFYLGNNRQASGWSATVPGIDMSWEGGYKQSVAYAEQSLKRSLKRSEVSDFWYDLTWSEIKASPGNFVALLVRKTRLLFNGYEIPNNQNIYMARDFAQIVKPLLIAGPVYIPFGLIAPLALFGLIFSLKQWRRFLILYIVILSYSSTLILFFVCARFRQPVVGLLILLSIMGLAGLVDLYRRRSFKNLALAAIVLALLIVESNHDMLGLDPARLRAEDHLVLGNAALRQGNLDRGELEFRRAIAADSSFARGYHNLGYIATRRSKRALAVGYFRKAIQIDPGSIDSYVNLATTYGDLAQHDSAIVVLKQAARINPLNDFVFYKLGMTYLESGRKEDAVKVLQHTLRLNPSNAGAAELLKQLNADVQ
ncbi:MAG: tetratricopeptide repeat protein [Candidatus Zixiibacteriota bacterium]